MSGRPPYDSVQGRCSAEEGPPGSRLAKTKTKKKKKRRKEEERKRGKEKKEEIIKVRGRREIRGDQSKLKPPISAKITVHCD